MNGARKAWVAAGLVAGCLVAGGVAARGEEKKTVSAEVLELLEDRGNPVVAERVAGAIDLLRNSDFEDDVAARVKEWIAQEPEP